MMATAQKEGYEKLLADLRGELEKLRDRENASSEARFALEEEFTEKAVALEADWRSMLLSMERQMANSMSVKQKQQNQNGLKTWRIES